MNINLYPYNFYILIISCIFLIVFLVLTIQKLTPLEKTIAQESETIKKIQEHLSSINTKVELLNQKKKKESKNNTYLKAMLPMVIAIYSTYKDDEALKGFKGYRKATSRVIRRKLTMR